MTKIDKLLKETPLSTRLNVLNETTFITLITKLGYRDEKMWSEDENDKLNIIREIARTLTTDTLTEIKEWVDDGSPQ